ncbi:MAG: hypothetical protein JW774_08120 [Candidatus Aureabacteria bacterium]|nr:hypothetical protein [Candidatus Auribacterota bacterium]
MSILILCLALGFIGTGGFFFFSNQDKKKLGLILGSVGFLLLLVALAMMFSVFFFGQSPAFKNEF